jgi:hypothetical protein
MPFVRTIGRFGDVSTHPSSTTFLIQHRNFLSGRADIGFFIGSFHFLSLTAVDMDTRESRAISDIELGCKQGVPGIPGEKLFEGEVASDSISPLDLSTCPEQCEETHEMLMDGLQRECFSVFVFIALCGLVWSKKRKGLITYNIVLFCGLMAIGGIFDSQFHEQESQQYITTTAFTLQWVSLILCFWNNAHRLNAKCSKLELMMHSKTLLLTLSTGVIATTVSLISVPFAAATTAKSTTWLGASWGMIGVFITCLFLAANSHFVFVDAKVVSCLISSLTSRLARYNTLNVEDVNIIRKDIDNRLKAGFVASSALVGIALINVVISLGLFVFVDDTDTLLLIAAYFLKEVVVASFGLYFAARANEQYHTLVHSLGQVVETSKMTQMADNQQVSVSLQALIATPIQFPLVGLNLTRKDVIVRFSLYLFSMLLSGVKNVI